MNIMGQLFGDYEVGCKALGLEPWAYDAENPKNASHYGFHKSDYGDSVFDYDDLQNAWAELVDNGILSWDELTDESATL